MTKRSSLNLNLDLNLVLERCRTDPPNVLRTLLAVQEAFGYVAPSAVPEIARTLGVTEADVAGVLSAGSPCASSWRSTATRATVVGSVALLTSSEKNLPKSQMPTMSRITSSTVATEAAMNAAERQGGVAGSSSR